MYKILKIAYYELIKNIRDIKMIFLLIVSPLILIFILGSSLDSMFTLKDMPTPIAGYVNLDQGERSDSLDVYLNEIELQELVVIKPYPSMSNAVEAMDKGEIDCIILLNANYSELLNSNQETFINISGTEHTTYVETIINNYVTSYNIYASVIKHGLTPDSNVEHKQLERGNLNETNKFPSTMDYYSVQTMFQLLLICSVFGVMIVLRDFTDGFKVRINSLPVKQYQLLIGRLIGSTLYSLIAALATILFSKYVYHANWNGNFLIIGLTILIFIVITIGIGVLLGQITRNFSVSMGIISILCIILPAAAGAISPKTNVKPIAIISPNYYAKNAVLGTIYDFSNQVIWKNLLSLVIIAVVIYSFIFILERRRKNGHI